MSEKEEKIFNEIFLQFHPVLLRFGKKIVQNEYLAEESIQELFIYIYEKDVQLSTIGNLRAYLFTAFRRRLLLKKQSTPQLIDIASISTDILFQASDFADNISSSNQRNAQLASLLNDLPWRQREALFLKYFNKLSTKEIANIMGIQPQVVSNTIYKALKKMKDIAHS